MKYEFSDPEDLIRCIQEDQKGRERFLITVDGPCACGKTTLSLILGEALQAFVLHTDDFVIPHAQKTKERLSIPGGNCDSERLVQEVIMPWKNGTAGEYRRYDCRKDCMRAPEKIPDSHLLILEGSYCNLPVIRRYADFRIFMVTSENIRKYRLHERESPESIKMFDLMWIPMENAYFKAFSLPDPECHIFRTNTAEGSDEKEE